MSDRPRRIAVLTDTTDWSIRPPGSKSETIRALAAAAMAEGRSHLYMPLRADDPAAMVGALQKLGIAVNPDSEPLVVDGLGGRLRPSARPIDVNESGLTARILLAMAGSLDGATRIEGRGRLPQRPMGGIVEVLRSQGVDVSGDRLPIEIIGRGRLWGGQLTVDCSQSSQFATAVMLVAPLMHEPCVLEVAGLTGSAGYLEVTAATMRRFGARLERTVTGYEIANHGYQPADVVIEPDASAAVYPMAIAAISRGRVVIEGLSASSAQPDLKVASVLEAMGCVVEWGSHRVTVDARDVDLEGVDVDMSDAPDGSLGLAVVCLFATGSSRVTGLSSLRHKESDRLRAIGEEIRRIGGDVEVGDDFLHITPGPLHGAEIDPHGDHRIAMAMATVGTRVAGVEVSDPDVVTKTWPGFWDLLDKLA